MQLMHTPLLVLKLENFSSIHSINIKKQLWSTKIYEQVLNRHNTFYDNLHYFVRFLVVHAAPITIAMTIAPCDTTLSLIRYLDVLIAPLKR